MWKRRIVRTAAVLLMAMSPVDALEIPDPAYELDLGGRRLDLRQEEAAAVAYLDLHLVQFEGPTQAEWLEALRAADLEVLQYIHPFTYIVWGADPGSRLGHSFVRATGFFSPEFRLQPQWRILVSEPIDVRVLLYRGAGEAAVVGQLETLGGELRGTRVIDHRFSIAGFRMAGDLLQQAAAVPGVYSLRPVPTDGGLRSEMSSQVNVNNVDGSNMAFPGYFTWLGTVGLDGNGVRLANVDGGVNATHEDLQSRMVSCSGTTCSSADSSHGTHTAGIMAADGSSGATDPGGFLEGLGVAPGAELFEQEYSPYFTLPGGMLLLMKDSSQNGAVLSGNSWGPAGTPQGYDDDTMQVDIGVRDADVETLGNQALNYILSLMNGFGGTSTQGTPDEAKNIFTIGSTKMRSSGGPQDPNINDLSSNSSHGPALDGRTIPHMVAPGCYVLSTVPGSHGLMCGTSMASPQVSGAVGLFVEYYRGLTSGPVGDPSPALVKAAFLPVAHDLAGFDDADGNPMGRPFDSKQGWGRLDLEAVVDPSVEVAYFDNPLILDNTAEEWVETLTVGDTGEPVRLMLVWTDAPGHGLGGSTPAWNNDLDLVVEVGANTYRGNNFGPDGWSVPGGTADGMNNTEGVFLGPAAPSEVTVRVIASNINSDGIPGQGDDTDQDFALVCYNCSNMIFADGFESGDTSAWSNTVP